MSQDAIDNLFLCYYYYPLRSLHRHDPVVSDIQANSSQSLAAPAT